MNRLTFLLLLAVAATLGAASASAERITDFNETVFLRDYETVRYRVPITYGTALDAHIRIYVRGFSAPPRVRLLESDYHEVKERRDTSGDWTVDFEATAVNSQPRYYIEVDSALSGYASDFEIRVQIDALDGAGATAEVEFVKYFFDYDNGGPSDHHDCTTGENTQPWPLVVLSTLVAGLWFARRRLKSQQA